MSRKRNKHAATLPNFTAPAPILTRKLTSAQQADLAFILTAPKSWFPGDVLPTKTGGQLRHVDNGARVLGVAHLDWVGDPADEKPAEKPQMLTGKRWDLNKGCWVDYSYPLVGRYGEYERPKGPKYPLFSHDGSFVRFPSLDDRLGAWSLLHLSQTGVKIDLLFTDDEEKGQTTAEFFTANKGRYNWIFSMDRAGTDVVLYQYDDVDSWKSLLKNELGPVARGSFSCIGKLEQLGVCGFNLGIGYHEHNGPHCWADLRETRYQLDRFRRFHRRYAHQAFPLPDDFQKPRHKGSGFRGADGVTVTVPNFYSRYGSYLGSYGGYVGSEDAIGFKGSQGHYSQGMNQGTTQGTQGSRAADAADAGANGVAAAVPDATANSLPVIAADDQPQRTLDSPFLTDGSSGFCDLCGKLGMLDIDTAMCRDCTYDAVAEIRTRL